MKRMPLLSAAAWTAMTVAALAGTRHVVPAGTEGNVPAAPYETWETAANDLRDALAVAQMGDEILVRPGVYAVTEQITVTAKNLTIRSCDPVTGAPDRDGTVFDGLGLSGEAAGMFTVAAGVAGVTLDGLTLRNSPVGGLSCPSSPRTHVLNCAFTGNTANGASGGGAYISGNGAVVSNCLFEANRAARISGRGGNGGGLYMPGNEQTRGYVVDCVFGATRPKPRAGTSPRQRPSRLPPARSPARPAATMAVSSRMRRDPPWSSRTARLPASPSREARTRFSNSEARLFWRAVRSPTCPVVP